MRIISGEYRGRTIVTVKDKSVRPAMDRVKATIFNMLQNRLNLVDAQVLDLFAGSGSLGFEALSRGAARAVFIDNNSEALDVIEANARTLGCEDRTLVISDDALRYAGRGNGSFDLIFADPPYRYEQILDLPSLIFRNGLLKTGGFLIIEHSKYSRFESTQEYRLAVQKQFGTTRVSFFTHPEPSPESQEESRP